jgi:hypothetical protein
MFGMPQDLSRSRRLPGKASEICAESSLSFMLYSKALVIQQFGNEYERTVNGAIRGTSLPRFSTQRCSIRLLGWMTIRPSRLRLLGYPVNGQAFGHTRAGFGNEKHCTSEPSDSSSCLCASSMPSSLFQLNLFPRRLGSESPQGAARSLVTYFPRHSQVILQRLSPVRRTPPRSGPALETCTEELEDSNIHLHLPLAGSTGERVCWPQLSSRPLRM